MRDLTEKEIQVWNSGKWPCCKGTSYNEGPEAGILMNVSCPTCGTVINVTNPKLGMMSSFGQMVKEPEGYVTPQPSPIAQVQPKGWFTKFKHLFSV